MVELGLLGFLLMRNRILVLEAGELYNQGFIPDYVTNRELGMWLGNTIKHS